MAGREAGQAALRPDGEWLRASFRRVFARLPVRDKRSRGCVSFAGFFAHFKEIGSGASPQQTNTPTIESRTKQATVSNEYFAVTPVANLRSKQILITKERRHPEVI